MGSGRVLDTETKKKFRLTFNVIRSLNAEGGHSETNGLTADGQIIQVGSHWHHVAMSFSRLNLGLHYQLNSRIKLALVVPYSIKDQSAEIEWKTSKPSLTDQNAAIRNGYIHHRDETYRGFEDLNLTISYYWNEFTPVKTDSLTLSAGLSVPTGKIEPNPYKLGDAGKEHLHLQFGTGTLIPNFKIIYTLPVNDSVSLQSRLSFRRPLYENKYDFLSPSDISFYFGVAFKPSNILRLHGSWMVFRQGFGYWDGSRDENTGMQMHALQLGINTKWGQNLPVNISVILPIHQKMMIDTGDTFEHGIMLSSSISHVF